MNVLLKYSKLIKIRPIKENAFAKTKKMSTQAAINHTGISLKKKITTLMSGILIMIYKKTKYKTLKNKI